ncbi:MAG: dTDP-4-dehydrorhamnose 3,5-epimerase family protein [Deltaproteobacteria bacterium]|nr:dTDP-4-dehydrorhamnose 3,5-epimerase family protein [Deltaproteobacteria bacterium]
MPPVHREGGIIVRGTGPLIRGVEVRVATVIPDERGRLGEILRADDPWFEKFGQVYFTTTLPGVVKAWHHHRKQTDHFYVMKGCVKIGLHDGRDGSPTRGVLNELYLGEHCPGLLKIPPGVWHGWMCTSPEEAYILNVVSEMYDRASPDEFRAPPHGGPVPYDWARRDG